MTASRVSGVDESFIDQRFKQKSNLHMEEVCQKIITNFDFTQKHAQDTETSVSDKKDEERGGARNVG